MATELRYPKGHMFFGNNGAPLANGTIEYFEAGTTTNEPAYLDAAGAIALPNPVTLNSAGRAVDGSGNLAAIYLSDAGNTDYKETVKDSYGVAIWTDDDIPKPIDPAASLSDTAKPRIQWSTDTDPAINLSAGDLGSGRLADTSSSNITYSPISASTAGNGNGFLIKKTSAANSIIFDPDGDETIDGEPVKSWTGINEAVWILSDGANWRTGSAVFDAPVGTIAAWPAASAPGGWYECDGSAKSRSANAALFAVIGVSFGNGDGSTTFNLPDLRGEFIRGWDHGAGNDVDAASRTDRGDGVTGDNVGTRQGDAIRNITGTVADVDGTTSNSATTGAFSGSTSNSTTSAPTGSNSRAQHEPLEFDASNAPGVLTGGDNRPRNVAMMWIIKA